MSKEIEDFSYEETIKKLDKITIYLEQEKPNESEILVRINSFRRHIRDTSMKKDGLKNFLRRFHISRMSDLKFLGLPTDAEQLFLLVSIATPSIYQVWAKSSKGVTKTGLSSMLIYITESTLSSESLIKRGYS